MFGNLNGVTATAGRGFQIHVRFGGRSFDLEMSTLDLGSGSDDASIRRAVAGQLNVSPNRLSDHVIDRHANGNLTLRPQAVFG